MPGSGWSRWVVLAAVLVQSAVASHAGAQELTARQAAAVSSLANYAVSASDDTDSLLRERGYAVPVDDPYWYGLAPRDKFLTAARQAEAEQRGGAERLLAALSQDLARRYPESVANDPRIRPLLAVNVGSEPIRFRPLDGGPLPELPSRLRAPIESLSVYMRAQNRVAIFERHFRLSHEEAVRMAGGADERVALTRALSTMDNARREAGLRSWVGELARTYESVPYDDALRPYLPEESRRREAALPPMPGTGGGQPPARGPPSAEPPGGRPGPRPGAPPASGGGWNLGGRPLGGGPARTMQTRTPASRLRASIRRIGFVGRVGGVAFGAEARPGPGARGRLSLQYDSSASDGRRILVVIGTRAARVPVHDWIAIPAALFVDSDRAELFTAFGELDSPEETARIFDAGGFVFNYHPAIVNTLIGLRIMQADMLSFHPRFCELPASGTGAPILGPGERAPIDPEGATARRAAALQTAQFTSYVLSDVDSRFVFRVENGEIVVSGAPAYFFWRHPDLEQVRRQAHRQRDPVRYLARELFDEQVAEGERMPAEWPLFEAAARRRHSQAELEEFVRRQRVEAVPGGSFDDFAFLRGLNPTVFDAIRTFARYAAFFRYVRRTSPNDYAAFIASVRSIRSTPEVQTPSFVERSELALEERVIEEPPPAPLYVLPGPGRDEGTWWGWYGLGGFGACACIVLGVRWLRRV